VLNRLHYVRNHGSVPILDWNSHTLLVYAEPAELVPKPQEFTMKQLAENDLFEVVEIPVTLACDGNRRGEVNSMKKR
jgi:nitrate reductase (NAD(P)H)